MVKSNLAYKAQDTVVPEVVVNESPIKWCAVALSDVIARGKRLEASVFDVEAKQARSLIAKGKYTQSFIGGASGMASSYVCGRFKRIWVEKSDTTSVCRSRRSAPSATRSPSGKNGSRIWWSVKP